MALAVAPATTSSSFIQFNSSSNNPSSSTLNLFGNNFQFEHYSSSSRKPISQDIIQQYSSLSSEVLEIYEQFNYIHKKVSFVGVYSFDFLCLSCLTYCLSRQSYTRHNSSLSVHFINILLFHIPFFVCKMSFFYVTKNLFLFIQIRERETNTLYFKFDQMRKKERTQYAKHSATGFRSHGDFSYQQVK